MRKNIVGLVTAILIIVIFCIKNMAFAEPEDKDVKVGFIYVGDASTAYTKNFIKAQRAVDEEFGDKVTTIAKYNVAEGAEAGVIQELIDEGCNIIFATSYGYSDALKEAATNHPDIQFCQATGDNANEAPVLNNYHTFMGHIAEGRYVSGIVAGLKMQEMIDQGIIQPEEAVIGYVGAFPYAEVISGYTAFVLGARKYCPSATMQVVYTNTWSDYAIEKEYAERLINSGCVIIAQHSDTKGPALACEESNRKVPVYSVGYNQSMMDIAPTTALVSCKIDWEPYIKAAIQAVMKGKEIESNFENGVAINEKDAGAGFNKGWVKMLDLNEVVAPKKTGEIVNQTIEQFKRGTVHIFSGTYTGVNPYDSSDTINFKDGYYRENAASSAPTFNYILNEIVTVVSFDED